MRVLVALLVLLAGCLQPAPPTAAGEGPAVQGPAVGEPAPWTDCEQWHLHFDARAEDFRGDVPPGFTVADDEQGLTTLLIHVTLCPDAREALVAVPVVAPEEHEDPERAEIAVLEVFHAGHGDSLYPPPFASRLVPASFERTDTPQGPRLTIAGGGQSMDLLLSLAPGSGGFPGERWARFAADGDRGVGILTADGNASTSLGFGTVAYVHQGPGGAPPATAGVAHVVGGLDVRFTREVRP